MDKKIEKAFDADCLAKKYIDSNSRYKCKHQKDGKKIYPIATALKDIYKNKCAYCETRFNRSYIKIEHYRPKSIYYTLAYSWTNLLPICDICNTIKLDNFDILAHSLVHKLRIFSKIHYNTKVYNYIEQPKFIHPEIDEYENLFRFNTKGEMIVYADNIRIKYTIKYAYLNETDLMERRAKVLEDFNKMRDDLYHSFKIAIKHKDKEAFAKFKTDTKEKIKDFFEDTNEFIAVRKYIIKRLRFFLAKLDKKFKQFFERYLENYTDNIAVYNYK